MEKNIDVTAVRRQLGTLLDEVFNKGDVFTIKRKGKALAQIIPINKFIHQEEKTSISPNQKELLKELDSLPNIGIDKEPVGLLRTMRENRRIKAANQYNK